MLASLSMPRYLRNRRRAPRVPIRCLVIGAVPDGSVWASQTEDLSKKGCQLALPERLLPGGAIALTITDERLDDALEVGGRVAWISTQPPWRAGISFETDDTMRAAAWFERLVAAHPDVGASRHAPERVPVAAAVFPAEPPAAPLELGAEEVLVLEAVGAGCTAGELRERLGERWAVAEGAFFSLLGRRLLTLSRAAAVPPRMWAPLLARYRG
jgi:PilZ domain